MIIGFAGVDDGLGYRLEDGERFLARIESSRRQLREGRTVRLDGLPD